MKKHALFGRFLCLLLFSALLLSACGQMPPESPPITDSVLSLTPAPTSAPTPTPSPTPAPTPTPIPPISAFSDVLTADIGAAVSPVLLPGEDDRTVTVQWVGSFREEPPFVIFGIDNGSGALPPDFSAVQTERTPLSHLSALSPGRYSYRASLPVEAGMPYVYGLSADAETAPDTLFSFVAAGEGALSVTFTSDSHIENAAHTGIYENTLEQALAQSLADDRDHRGIDLIWHAGDLMNRMERSPTIVADNAAALRNIPFAVVGGNHDYRSRIHEVFTMPNIIRKSGDFYFMKGGVLFLGLSIASKDMVDHAAFLREANEAYPDRLWTVLTLHYSIHSNGSHGNDRPVVNIRTFLEPIFSEIGVDIVFSGHDHKYCRSMLIGADGLPVEGSDGAEIDKADNERIYVTLPSSTGSKFYKHVGAYPYELAVNGMDTVPGYVLADFTEESITVSAYTLESDEPFDRFTIRRTNAP